MILYPLDTYRGPIRKRINPPHNDDFWDEQTRLHDDRKADREAEALALANQMAIEAEMMAGYEEYAAYLADVLPDLLHNLGLSYTRKYEQYGTPEEERVTYVEIDEYRVDWYGFYFWICTLPLPRFVTKQKFLDPEIAESLSLNINRKVDVELDGHPTRPGLWIVVYNSDQQNKLPKHVPFTDAFKALPRRSYLEIPCGFGINLLNPKGVEFFSIDLTNSTTAHMIVAGTTGGGKSVFTNQLMTALLKQMRKITQKGPDGTLISTYSTRFFLIDLKKGVEYMPYDGLAILGGDVRFHIGSKAKKLTLEDEVLKEVRATEGKNKKKKDISTPFITVPRSYDGDTELFDPLFEGQIIHDPNKVELLLDYCLAEVDRRGDMFRNAGVKSLTDWNKRYKKDQMSSWIIVIDEAAELLLLGQGVKIVHEKMASLAAIARAFGIHLIFSTQYPNSDVIPGRIKANMPVILALYCAYEYQSRTLVHNDDAKRLLSGNAGEGLLVYGKIRAHLQAPYQSTFMNNEIIRSIDKAVSTGAEIIDQGDKYKIDPGDIWEFVLNNIGGNCTISKLRTEFRPINELEKILSDYEVKVVGENGNRKFEPIIPINIENFQGNGEYVLSPPGGGPIPRKLIPLNEFEQNFEQWKDKIASCAMHQTQNGSNGRSTQIQETKIPNESNEPIPDLDKLRIELEKEN